MPSNTYLICTSPRTGSTLLSEGLGHTLAAGRPAEYFDDRPHVRKEVETKLGITTDAEYLKRILQVTTTPNGVCGLKVHWHQKATLEDKIRSAYAGRPPEQASLSLDDFQRHTFGPVRYIWLTRRDKVAQGVSLYTASRTRLWHRRKHSELRLARPPRMAKGKKPKIDHNRDWVVDGELQFNFDDIDRLVHRCITYDTNWQMRFQEHSLTALTVIYEDFVPTYEATLRGVLKHLDIPYEGGPINDPKLEKLTNARSLEWCERYRKMKFARVSDTAIRAMDDAV